MGFLMKKFFILFTLFSLHHSVAAPPYDLTDPMALNSRRDPGSSDLNVKDLTFVDDHSLYRMTENLSKPHLKDTALGRSLPNRKGKILYRFKKNEAVTVLKNSIDGFWTAVESTGSPKQRSWVPKNLIVIPEHALEQEKTPLSSESPDEPEEAVDSEN